MRNHLNSERTTINQHETFQIISDKWLEPILIFVQYTSKEEQSMTLVST